MKNLTTVLAGCLLAGTLSGIQAAQAAPQELNPLEEILVVADKERRTYELAETLDIAPDSAALLKKAVGANVVVNGPISGMAQYRGMSRMRISSRINGQVITPGGPNWMDPPLSYAPAAHLESLEVHRGIAGVSAGMETVGGVVNATTWSGEFADSGFTLQGRIRAGVQSVNNATLLSGAFVAADSQHRLKLSGLTESADDASFSAGEILPTEYRRKRVDIGYGYQRGRHFFQFDYGRNETGDAGTPALPMDIQSIDSDLFGFSYRMSGSQVTLDANVYYSDIDHDMSNYHLRPPPQPGLQRRNQVEGRNSGFRLAVSSGGWKFGVDGHEEVHDSRIDNPANPMFFVTNFNNAERLLLGAFVEYNFSFGEAWFSELGVRVNRVTSDADEVNATPAMAGMPPAVVLRDRFNAADRELTDNNVDWVAKLYYAPSAELSYYAGIARKTRSPSYQERYLWIPLQATAGLADGYSYTGVVDLAPEVSHELEFGIDYSTNRFQIAPRIFYREVDDYIQGDTSSNAAAVMLVRVLNAMNGTSVPDPLEFTNVDARFYGIDVDFRLSFGGRWSLDGVVNYVRGKRTDVSDNLYRIAPLNAYLALNYQSSAWGMSVESFVNARQSKVSSFNNESTTSSYSTINLVGFWEFIDNLRGSAGVENLFDENYSDHLGGLSRVRGNPDIAVGDRLPGFGRSFFARIDYTF